MHNDFQKQPLPDPIIDNSQMELRRLSLVWLVPLLALLLGIWLAYQHFSSRGPGIIIAFESAQGLEEGKTRIRYRDVEVGKVEKIELDDSLTSVRVTARMVKGFDEFLTDRTRFWVEKPRIGAGGISGLGTIVSGFYIGVDPVNQGKYQSFFYGMEEPPLTAENAPGLRLTLSAERAGSVQVGSPVYYRQVKVGRVESRRLTDDNQAVEFEIFIDAPHHKLVNSQSRFWNSSGFEVKLDDNGLRLQVEALESLVYGGISFAQVGGGHVTKPIKNGDRFTLFDDSEAAREHGVSDQQGESLTYVLLFEGSLQGLQIGASVEFAGAPIGRVREIRSDYGSGLLDIKQPVVIELYPQQISDSLDLKSGAEAIRVAVAGGLRAQLQSRNLITGQLYIELKSFPVGEGDAELSDNLLSYADLSLLPTRPAELEQMKQSASEILQKLKTLPLNELLNTAQHTLATLDGQLEQMPLAELTTTANTTLISLNKVLDTPQMRRLPKNLQQTLSHLNTTLVATEKTMQELSPQSNLYLEMSNTLVELQEAARSVRAFVDALEQKPNSLIFGQ